MGRFSVTLSEYEYELLQKYIDTKHGMKENKGVNELVKLGISKYNGDGNEELIRKIIREQIQFTLKPYTESLASLSSKVAHMSGRSIFLLVQFALDILAFDKNNGAKIKELHKEASVLAKNNRNIDS